MERQEPIITERSERIFLNTETGNAFMTSEACEMHGDGKMEPITLYRPNLRPIYGGPTLLEALWSEMDRLMENLMTGVDHDEDVCGRKGYHGVPLPYDDSTAPCEHWDNGDKYRAQELAWVIAIVTDPYNPSVNAVRIETMKRWESKQKGNAQ